MQSKFLFYKNVRHYSKPVFISFYRKYVYLGSATKKESTRMDFETEKSDFYDSTCDTPRLKKVLITKRYHYYNLHDHQTSDRFYHFCLHANRSDVDDDAYC